MTKKEADIIARRIIGERNDKADRIIMDAKAKGIWKPGLDSNRELFKELDLETKKKLEALKGKITE